MRCYFHANSMCDSHAYGAFGPLYCTEIWSNCSYTFCCREVENVVSGNRAHAERLMQKIGDLTCITEHVSFASVCLDKEVTSLLICL